MPVSPLACAGAACRLDCRLARPGVRRGPAVGGLLAWLACAPVLLVAAACASKVDVDAERRALLEADAAFSKAADERGLEGFLEFVSQDAVFYSGAAF